MDPAIARDGSLPTLDLAVLLDALHRLHVPVPPADFPAHVLEVLSRLVPGHTWTLVPAATAGDADGGTPTDAAALAFAAAVLDRPPGGTTLRATPPLPEDGPACQRADALLRVLTAHVSLARAHGQRLPVDPPPDVG